MPFKSLLKVAIRAIKANKSRSLLTSLGVIIGVASVILLVSVGSGLKDYITSEMQDMGSNLVMVMPGEINLDKLGAGGSAMSSSFAAMSASKLKLEDLSTLKQQVPYLEEAVGLVMGSAPIRYKNESKSTQVLGTTADYTKVRSHEFESGGFFTEADVNSGRKVAVIGYKIADEVFGSPYIVGEKFKLGEYRYTVIGVIAESGGQGSMSPDDKIYVPITVAQRQFNQDHLGIIFAQAKSSDDVAPAVSMTKEVMGRRLDSEDFTVLDQKEILSTVSGILNTLTIALGGIAAISLLVGGIGIMNIMLVSVTERTQEIGLRKALGAKPEVILTQFLLEASILSIGGGVIGILAGAGGALLIGKFMPTTVAWWSIVLAFLVSAGVGIIFGVTPAKKASELSPIEALRHE